ncbi:MAG: hypothetical protein IT223_05520 [Crocinitomicaceae bacterium]|nr:hypothetical protein [Crocinitomicaceae bacterium]
MNKQLLLSLLSMGYASMSVLGATLIKSRVTGYGLHQPSDYLRFLFEPRVISGMFVIFLSALVLFKALSVGDFNFVIPLSAAINFILTALIGTLVFNEKAGWTTIGGIALILGGIILLNFRK